ncbi:nuclear architecture related protein [Spathaspora passalidarum NRRL Y-27907]|uniref:Cytosolic Fe-S cluster assembly factor NAR1 n=1 Tax=Spathaspora passalidarum (strain NRRL Y-27907 / 11-Y1) TaxID=619300 RepID=G3AQ19_SPAPN|nr:nuclear architecture related protein [Spathaspora passalidarum NRRL Y-27907]EGW32340.1 nuclear architecture related protein [Spathaspora passalidarum NRRL Y-27907]
MSALLSADDLNDFISPGVACIKPIETPSKSNELEIEIDAKPKSVLAPAQISLADCLACSGCITSAEEVLVAQHSHKELLKALETDKVFVASVSHQARASLALAYNVDVEQLDQLLIHLLKKMGFRYIVGTSLGRKLSLVNESNSMIQRKMDKTEGPTLSSICPGWVLYAEKTHPYIIPRLSNVKSPQQVTGCILKNLTSEELNVPRNQVYHLTIMPCFDKKLESARPEVDGGTSDVDCVLTPREVVALIEEMGYDLIAKDYTFGNTSQVYKESAPNKWPFVEYAWSNDSGSASGGYGYTYLRLYQQYLISKENYIADQFEFKVVKGRNADIYEMRLMYQDTQIASSGIVNGFKNIQNLVRKLKPGNTVAKPNALLARRRGRGGSTAKAKKTSEEADPSKCDYVEIMACPSGCINGGGQISPAEGIVEKDWIALGLEKYGSIGKWDVAEQVDRLIEWSNSFVEQSSMTYKRVFETKFSEVEKVTDANVAMFGAKW